MHRITLNRFDRAFVQARVGGSRDSRVADSTPVPRPVVRTALRILSARRAALEAEPCPTWVRRRIEAWFASRRESTLRHRFLTRFDSDVQFAPVARGTTRTTRTLRYVGAGATVDVQIRGAESFALLGLSLHLAVNPANPGATVEVRVPHRRPPQRALLDGDGTVCIRLMGRPRSVTVTLRTPNVPALRLPVLDLN